MVLEVAKKVVEPKEIIPQRLKPDLLASTYVRAEARTLQKPEFFLKLFSRAVQSRSEEGFGACARTSLMNARVSLPS